MPDGVQGYDRYAYVSNSPINNIDPTGHRTCTDDGYCPGYSSPDGGWNYARYSTWNKLRWGSGCTACHVTHDQPGDWSIPTNEQIDGGLVNYYRSLDDVGRTVNTAAFFYAGGVASAILADARPTLKLGAANGPTAGEPFPQSVRNQAFAENPTSTCVYCGMDGTGTQVDHVIPKALGGDATIENAQLACPHCNASKGARLYPLTPPADYVGAWPPSWWPSEWK